MHTYIHTYTCTYIRRFTSVCWLSSYAAPTTLMSQELKCNLTIANSMVRHAYNIYERAGCFLLWINLCIFVFVYIHNIRCDSTDYQQCVGTLPQQTSNRNIAGHTVCKLKPLSLQCCNVIINQWKDTRLSCGCNYRGVYTYSLASVLALLCSGRQQSNFSYVFILKPVPTL